MSHIKTRINMLLELGVLILVGTGLFFYLSFVLSAYINTIGKVSICIIGLIILITIYISRIDSGFWILKNQKIYFSKQTGFLRKMKIFMNTIIKNNYLFSFPNIDIANIEKADIRITTFQLRLQQGYMIVITLITEGGKEISLSCFNSSREEIIQLLDCLKENSIEINDSYNIFDVIYNSNINLGKYLEKHYNA